MRLVLAIIEAGKVLYQIVFLAIHPNLIGWRLLAAVVLDKLL
jgi:hypothetical protein